MTVLRPPDVDHIRLKIPQLPKEEFFQSLVIGICFLFLKQRELRAVFQCSGSIAAKAQQPQGNPALAADTGKDMFDPKTAV